MIISENIDVDNFAHISAIFCQNIGVISLKYRCEGEKKGKERKKGKKGGKKNTKGDLNPSHFTPPAH